MIKKLPKFIEVTDQPVIIVGEKMGRQRPGQDLFALEGNRTGDFVHEAIGNKTNIILTNICNYYYEGNFRHDSTAGEGLVDLMVLIKDWLPKKIICLGNISAQYVESIKGNFHIVKFPHPSWINRFKSKQRSEYIKLLSDAIES